MPRQTQTKPKPRPTTHTDTATDTEAAPAPSQSTTATDLLDADLLDEIDAVLEENAVEVLHRFVQRGGQ